MKLVVTGGRDYQLTSVDLEFLDEIARVRGIDELIHGAASGADTAAAAWAERRMIPTRPVPAKWERFGRAAGPIRNAELVAIAKRERAVLAAFPGNRGTANMITQAQAAGVEVLLSPTRPQSPRGN